MDVSSPEGLANHAETLSDYLYEYGRNPSQRTDYSMKFSEYLVSACWEKLHRQFCSWQRLGLIRKFEEGVELLEGHLDIIEKSVGPKDTFLERGPGDRTLVNFLYLNRDNIFREMLPSTLPSDMHRRPSPSVFDKLYEAVVYAFENNDLEPLYTKETALGFHYLVYCVFLLAGQAIKLIKDHSQPLKKRGAEKKVEYSSLVETFKMHIKAAIMPMKFLQFVLSSTVFKGHIGVWTNDGESLHCLLPKWTEKKINLVFGRNRQILVGSKMEPLEESPIEGGNGDGDTPNESPTGGGENDDASKESPSERCKDNDDDDDDDDDDDSPEVSKSIW